MIQFLFPRLNKQRSVWLTLFVLMIQTAQAQNVGIGTSNPVARLHVADSNVLFSGPANIFLNTTSFPPVQGQGARMMWYAQKAAFRAGYVFNNQWDKDSIGVVSVALGNNTKAKGESSFASGAGTNAYGDRSTAMGENTLASGYGAFAVGSSTIAAGRNAVALGGYNVAGGDYSVALGTSNNATGFASFAFGQMAQSTSNTSIAMGIYANAAGGSSVAIGQYAEATGTFGYALGYRAQATGDAAVALGNEIRTRSYGSVALGSLNDTSDVITPGYSLPTDRLFQIGNGTVMGRSNAMTILRNGNTGLGTTTPLARLHIADSNMLITGPLMVPAIQNNPPVSGSGVRMMWYADKAAFRAGIAVGSSWDKIYTGNYSFATGYGAIASGNASFATGMGVASGNYSAGIGGGIATGIMSTAMGNGAEASGTYATAIGYSSSAKAFSAITMGAFNENTDNPNGTTAQPTDRLFQLGNGTSFTDRKNALTVLRNGNMGIGTTNPAKNLEIVSGPTATPTTVVIGNRSGFGPAALEFVSDYGLANQWRPGYIQSNDNGSFTGKLEFYTNGTGSGNLYGAVKGMEIRNGAVLTATGSVGSFSDERLKENIVPFTDGLNVINQINPVQFDYKANAPFASSQTQIGIIAQELEKIAPYMVRQTTEGNVQDMRWVDHQAYIFLLINAIKEQQQQLQEANKKIAAMQEKLNRLKD